MEFPSVGIRCSVESCKQLDFLPFTCSHCRTTFCREHFNATTHACPKFIDNTVSSKEYVANFCCSKETCKQTSPVEMPCVMCRLHFCLAHRYHGCLEIGEKERLKELENWEKPKEEFNRAKAAVDQEINKSLKKAKNASVANKVQLMRLKGRAVGPKGVPTAERCYFLVYLPITGSVKTVREPKAAFTCCRWTLGRTIDSLASTLGIPNTNNSSDGKKLRLFHHSTGLILSQQMETPLSEFFDSSALIDGQSLILEYSDTSTIDSTLYE